MDAAEIDWLWKFLFFGYLFTIAIEMPILVLGLSPRHPLRHRVFAGFWLTACTYPVVVLVLPQFIDRGANRPLYLAVAETFAPVAECALFWAAFGKREQRWKPSMWRDLAFVVLANLASFGVGEWVQQQPWYEKRMAPPATAPEEDGAGQARQGGPRDGSRKALPLVFVSLNDGQPRAGGQLPFPRRRRAGEPASRARLQICKVALLGMPRPGSGLEWVCLGHRAAPPRRIRAALPPVMSRSAQSTSV